MFTDVDTTERAILPLLSDGLLFTSLHSNSHSARRNAADTRTSAQTNCISIPQQLLRRYLQPPTLMQPSQTSTLTFLAKCRNVVTLLRSKHKIQQKCSTPSLSRTLKALPSSLPSPSYCYEPTFTRKTSGYRSGTFRAVYFSIFPAIIIITIIIIINAVSLTVPTSSQFSVSHSPGLITCQHCRATNDIVRSTASSAGIKTSCITDC